MPGERVLSGCSPASRIRPQTVTHGHVVRLLDEQSAERPGGVRWYALRTRSRHEFSVRDELALLGIERFLPTYTETTRWTDRNTVTTRPLFAGYIFARFDPLARASVFVARGVVEILSLDQRPVPIPDDEIAALKRAVDSPAAFERVPYVAGSTVRIESGPFAGISGIVTRTQGSATLTIPITILGRAVSVRIDAADCKAERTEKS